MSLGLAHFTTSLEEQHAGGLQCSHRNALQMFTDALYCFTIMLPWPSASRTRDVGSDASPNRV